MARLVHSACPVLAFLFVVSPAPATASPMGEIAAGLVEQTSYTHFLDDMLYTHDGDNRGFGPEHNLARDNIAALFESFGLTVSLEPFVYGSGVYFNVVATTLGTAYPNQEYIIGAHFDSVDNPGADDNASGVALVLEAARVLAPFESDYTIHFIAFDREEQGLHGSEAYAFHHIDDDILGMISADMVAYDNGAHHVNIYGSSASNPIKYGLADAVTVYGEGLSHSVYGALDASDHAPFEWYGSEACLIIEDYWSNPQYHEPTDSVDTPGYIDYDYATQITRVVVGFLVDNAGVTVILVGDYDADGDVDWDDYDMFASCFSGEGVTPGDPACLFFDFDSDADVDCTDWEVFAEAWTGPSQSPIFWPCTLLPPTATSEGGRTVAVTPPEHGLPMALLVTGDSNDPAVSCISRYVQTDGRLGPLPVFQTYDAWGTILVGGEELVPETSYDVWCDYGEFGRCDEAATATTALWGDVVGDFVDGQWTPANGTVDFNDITSIVDAFRHLPIAPPVSAADLVGPSGSECVPDLAIDFLDISAAVEAFKGDSYWESTSCVAPCN